MKILYCLVETFNSGGTERIVVAKANWLSLHGYEVVIVTTEQNGRNDFFPLASGVKRIDLDVLYSETNGLSPLLKFFARRKRVKQHKELLSAVIEAENPDIVISTFGNEVGILPLIKHRCKRVAEIHSSRWFRLRQNRKGILYLIDLFLTYQDKRVLSKYDQFVCLTEEDCRNWGNCGVKIDIIPNFIEKRATTPATLSVNSMIAVGRLCYEKGYERLLYAWRNVAKKHPNWTLDIYGGGELKTSLNELIDELGLSEVVRIYAPTNDIMSEYIRHSALVLSSRYEGLPMVLLEAISAGLPVVSFACQCGPRDVIENNKNGLLVEDGDILGLSNAINRIIEDNKLRLYLGMNAYMSSEKYLEDNVMSRWVNLFNEMMYGKRK